MGFRAKGPLTLHEFLYGRPDVVQLSFDPEGVIETPIPLAAAGIGGAAKKVGGKLGKLFRKHRKTALKAVKGGAAIAVEHKEDLMALAQKFMPGGAGMGAITGPMGPGGPIVHGHWTKPHGHLPSHWSPRRRPRMNPGNSRAMRRAIRRVKSGERMYSHLFHMVHTKRGVKLGGRRNKKA